MDNVEWSKLYKFFNRPISFNQGQSYTWSCANDLKDILGIGIYYQLYAYQDSSANGYVFKDQWQRFNDHVYHQCFSDREFLTKINDRILKLSQEAERFFISFSEINFKSLSNEELFEIFKQADKILKTKVSALWVGFLIREIIEKKLFAVLKKYDLEVEKSMEVVAGLEKPHYLIQENLDLLKIIASSDNIERDLRDHWQKYKYIPCYSIEVLPYDLNHFKERAEVISKEEAKKEIEKIEKGFKKAKTDFEEFIKENEFSDLDRLFIEYFHEFNFFQDYRSHFRSLLFYWERHLFLEIARRFNLKLEQLSLLLSQEIEEIFKVKGLTDKLRKALKDRSSRDSIYIFDNYKDEIIKRKDLDQPEPKSSSKNLKGTSASPGKTRGRVKKVMNPNNIKKVNQGDILVSPMTRPDFLPAIKKAAAIVTDEGGLLCHAAIVSRELKKPCIIGTREATNVLEDGDEIEIDANQGIIKILE